MLESDCDLICVTGFAVRTRLGQQLRACGPVRLVFGEPCIGGNVPHCIETAAGSLPLRDRERSINGYHR